MKGALELKPQPSGASRGRSWRFLILAVLILAVLVWVVLYGWIVCC